MDRVEMDRVERDFILELNVKVRGCFDISGDLVGILVDGVDYDGYELDMTPTLRRAITLHATNELNWSE